jgi:predicted kinase
VVGGLSGSGKSTIARELAATLGVTVLETDAIRHELLGTSELDARYGEGNYTLENREQVYDELFGRAQNLLRHRLSVILDATFLDPRHRHAVRSMAHEQGAALVSFHCHCAPAVARGRIVARQHAGRSKSEARPDIYDRQLQLAADASWPEDAISMDTEKTVDENLKRCLAALMQRYPAAAPEALQRHQVLQ